MVLLDLDTYVDLCLYIFSNFFLFKRDLQMSISKKRKSSKRLASKTSFTRKMWSNVWCQSQMLICQKYIKSSWHRFSKIWVVFHQKYEIWKSNEKLSINCKHIGEGSYMFIFTSEIGHLTSYLLCMTWLNLSLKFRTRLWTSSYLIHTHNTQV